MIERNDTPWCSRAEAASYLGEDEVTIDTKLHDSAAFKPGMLRYRLIRDKSKRNKPRIWKADVLAMLPPFED